jgi:hypothetical protein
MSKAYKAGFENLSQAADFIASAACTLTVEGKQNLIQSQIDLLPLHQGEYSGLRVDICLENPNTGETKWVDTTVVHTTCATYQNKELKAVAKKNLSASVASSHGVPDSLQFAPSPALLDREAYKVEKYSRLVMVAKKQHMDGKRSQSLLLRHLQFQISVNSRLQLLSFKNGSWTSTDGNVQAKRPGLMAARRLTSCVSSVTSSRWTSSLLLPQVLVQ